MEKLVGQSDLQNQKGLSGTHLKIIAVIAMLIDHMAIVLFPGISMLGLVMRLIGRISAPIFFFLIAEGYAHTRSFSNYLLRMGIFAGISYLPFLFFIHRGHLPSEFSGWFYFDVMYTLFLGLVALQIWERVSIKALRILLIIGILWLSSIGDWGIFGVLYILCFGIYRGCFRKQVTAFFVISGVMFVYFVGSMAMVITSSVTSADQPLTNEMAFQMLSVFIQIGVLLALIPLAFYRESKIGSKLLFVSNRWFFYLFYPIHLIILGMLARIF